MLRKSIVRAEGNGWHWKLVAPVSDGVLRSLRLASASRMHAWHARLVRGGHATSNAGRKHGYAWLFTQDVLNSFLPRLARRASLRASGYRHINEVPREYLAARIEITVV